MGHLLRGLLLVILLAIFSTVASAFGWIDFELSHIQLAIPTFLAVIFIQAFIMFYFIGVSKLVGNIDQILRSQNNLQELFEEPPKDLEPYIKKVMRYVHQATVCKRQTIPWTMLMLILGMGAFLLGGAHDTGMVSKKVHVGLVYGFLAALIIGFFRQWYYLGRSHKLLREIKHLFSLPDSQM